jgi:hydroxymethylglutaryl-CoA lyase
MEGTAEVFERIARRPGVTYAALVPNLRGFQDAMAAGADEVAVFAAATDTFSERNIGCTVEESFARFAAVTEAAAIPGVPVRGYVSTAFGCPYEGAVAPERAAAVVRRLRELGCAQIAVADTTGVGTPGQVERVLAAVAEDVPLADLAVHFHDTYGQALANTLVALQLGVSVVDAAVAGLGGCPFAAGARGNLATEDLLYMLHGLELATGIDLDLTIAAGVELCTHLDHGPWSRLAGVRARQGARCA